MADVILGVVSQNQRLLQQLLAQQATPVLETQERHRQRRYSKESLSTRTAYPDNSPGATHPDSALNAIANASIPPQHTSSAQAMLAWQIFDSDEELHRGVASMYRLERLRPPLTLSATMTFAYASPIEVSEARDCFTRNVNYWMLILTLAELDRLEGIVLSGVSTLDPDFCLAMSVMALGWACNLLEDQIKDGIIKPMDQPSRRKLHMSSLYFQAALHVLPRVQLETTRVTAQCLFFMVYV